MRGLLPAALLALGMVLPAGLVGAGPARPVCVLADSPHHVAVVVRHGDGRGLSRCVTFSGASITLEQALNASGIEHAYYDYGGSLGDGVCQVDGEPATPAGGWTRQNCLGAEYWAVMISNGGGAWTSAPRGVSNTYVGDGDAAGFAYGDGSQQPASPAGVCPAPPRPAAPPPAPSPTLKPSHAAPAATAAVSPAPSPSPSPAAGVAVVHGERVAAAEPGAPPPPPGPPIGLLAAGAGGALLLGALGIQVLRRR